MDKAPKPTALPGQWPDGEIQRFIPKGRIHLRRNHSEEGDQIEKVRDAKKGMPQKVRYAKRGMPQMVRDAKRGMPQKVKDAKRGMALFIK